MGPTRARLARSLDFLPNAGLQCLTAPKVTFCNRNSLLSPPAQLSDARPPE